MCHFGPEGLCMGKRLEPAVTSALSQIDLFEPANIYGMEENGPKPFLHLGQYKQQLYMHQDRKLGPQEPPASDSYVRLMLEHAVRI